DGRWSKRIKKEENKPPAKKAKKDDLEAINPFPILDLPGELSAKILSYVGPKELAVCLESFSLDKIHAEWNKDYNISWINLGIGLGKNSLVMTRHYHDIRQLMPCERHLNVSHRHRCDRFMHVFSKSSIKDLYCYVRDDANELLLREFMSVLTDIRCTKFLQVYTPGSVTVGITDELLRSIMVNRKEVALYINCEQISAAGLFDVWQDLLDGKFGSLRIKLDKSVAFELFYQFRKDTMDKKWTEYNMEWESEGRADKTSRFEIVWDHPYQVISMSIYPARRFR
ncbi:hypothetical protein PFISCL1PPCAC_22311, partial [Pristionchus fissidentatus]